LWNSHLGELSPRIVMELTYAQLSSAGPVRPDNEDYLDTWRPADADAERVRGTAGLLADGVGGPREGEVASTMAVEVALRKFREAKALPAPGQVLWQMFTAANLAVYAAGMQDRGEGRMGTTLAVSVFRNNEVTVGHVGDCRAYLLQAGRA